MSNNKNAYLNQARANCVDTNIGEPQLMCTSLGKRIHAIGNDELAYRHLDGDNTHAALLALSIRSPGYE